MASRDLWPPLEEVRQWAEAKIQNGEVAPVATGKYRNLIAVIDEILAAKSPGTPQDSPP
jgi:hypothetical protein